MKIKGLEKIKSLQQGGTAPYLSFSPTPTIPPSAQAPLDAGSATGTSTGQSPELEINKKAFEVLSTKGLTNDVNTYSKIYNDAKSKYLNLTEFEKTTAEGKRLLDIITGNNFSELNSILRGKEIYKDALSRAEKNDSLGSYATLNGKMIVDSKEGVKQVTTEDYFNNRDKYQALTNNDLINKRELDDAYSFNNEILKPVLYGVGLNTITDKLNSLALGQDTESNTFEKTQVAMKKYTDDVINSDLSDSEKQKLIEERSKGKYDIKILQKTIRNDRQINLAVDSFINQLSNAQRDTLKTNLAVNYDIKNDNELNGFMKSYVLSILMRRNSTTTEFVDEEERAAKMAKRKVDENKLRVKDTFVHNVANPTKLPQINLPISYGGSVLNAQAGSLGTPKDDDNKTITSLTPARAFGQLNNYFGTGLNNITIGDKEISKRDYERSVVVRPDDAAVAWLPYTIDSKGGMKPDLQLLKAIDNAKNKIVKNTAIKENLLAMQEYYNGIPELANKGSVESVNGVLEFVPYNYATFYMANVLFDPKLAQTEDLDLNESGRKVDQYERSAYARAVSLDPLISRDDAEGVIDEIETGGLFGLAHDIYETVMYVPLQSYDDARAFRSTGQATIQEKQTRDENFGKGYSGPNTSSRIKPGSTTL